MNPDALNEILSSNPRLRIADALSVRPRTLGELASITGISVQGVLRHLKRLAQLGFVEERKLPVRTLKARAVYAAKSESVGDYSTSTLTIVKSTENLSSQTSRRGSDPERTAGEILLLRRRVRDQARRLGRMIDEVVEEQEALRATLDGMKLGPEERLVLEVVLTEETLTDGLRVLSRYYGIKDRRSIDKALSKVKRSVGR